eukprot:13149731-Alexandrium_andersonii.AAC.1
MPSWASEELADALARKRDLRNAMLRFRNHRHRFVSRWCFGAWRDLCCHGTCDAGHDWVTCEIRLMKAHVAACCAH